ncbi:MAG: hypothetical protein H5U16_04950 [Roseovarius sp.]|nr:hypothetical protein [Roseovarius sp.]
MRDTPAFLTELDQLAIAAQQEEIRFRRSFAEEVEKRERARVFAFRRAGFLARMTTLCRDAEDEAGACAAVRAGFATEFGWHGASAARDAILARFEPVTRAICACLREEAADPAAEMRAFEAWYRDTTGADFLALFDQEPFEAPVVEF